MKKRRWKNEEKFGIVLEGLLRQASVVEICNKCGDKVRAILQVALCVS